MKILDKEKINEDKGIALIALIIIILTVILLIVGGIIFVVNMNNNGNDNKTAINSNQTDVANKTEQPSESQLLLPTISIDGVEYEVITMTLTELEENGFHIDYDHSGLYLDEEANEMYQGSDPSKQNILLTEERSNAKYMMQPDEYNYLDFRIINDNYDGMKYSEEKKFTYSPIRLGISNYSSDTPRNYKDCDIVHMEIGYYGQPSEEGSSAMQYVIENYPEINLNGIELGASESDIINVFGQDATRKDSFNNGEIEIIYGNDFQNLKFYVYENQLYRIQIQNKTTCFE